MDRFSAHLVPAPFADDLGDRDLGHYPRDEIVVARTSLLHAVQEESSAVWQGVKFKLGIYPDGRRLMNCCAEITHEWIPKKIPLKWTAPVTLVDANNPPSPVEEGEILSDSNDDDEDAEIASAPVNLINSDDTLATEVDESVCTKVKDKFKEKKEKRKKENKS